jgi:hypothetical protein
MPELVLTRESLEAAIELDVPRTESRPVDFGTSRRTSIAIRSVEPYSRP